MNLQQPRSTLTDTILPYTTRFRSKNSGGCLVAASAPVWLPATMTECQTAAGSSSPVCVSGAPQRLTTYQYGANGTANNLLVRGVTVSADGVMLRTCYGRSEEHTSELQSLMRISYAVFCLTKNKKHSHT